MYAACVLRFMRPSQFAKGFIRLSTFVSMPPRNVKANERITCTKCRQMKVKAEEEAVAMADELS